MVLRVPPYAGECRFVRVTSVLIFARGPGLCCFCVGAKTPDSQGYLPRSRLSRLSRPDGGFLPQRGARADPSAPDRTNAFEAPACVPGAALRHASAGRPGGNARGACCPSFCRRLQSPEPRSRLHTAIRKCLLSISKRTQNAESVLSIDDAVAGTGQHRTSSSGRAASGADRALLPLGEVTRLIATAGPLRDLMIFGLRAAGHLPRLTHEASADRRPSRP